MVAVFLIGNFAWSKFGPKRPDKPVVGSKLSIPNVDWSAGTTLVKAQQNGCKYCEESTTFYRRLREKAVGAKTRMLAVVPGDKAEISRYLSDQDLVVDELINVSLSDVSVTYTPTLLVVDRAGIIKEVWVGKLDGTKEEEVIRRIQQMQ